MNHPRYPRDPVTTAACRARDDGLIDRDTYRRYCALYFSACQRGITWQMTPAEWLGWWVEDERSKWRGGGGWGMA